MARVKLKPGGKLNAADDGYEVPRKDFNEACKSNFVGCRLLGVLTDEQGRRRWIYDIGHVKYRPVLLDDGSIGRKRVHTAVGCNMGGHDSQIQPACWYNFDKLETDHPGVGQIKKARHRVTITAPVFAASRYVPHEQQRSRRVKLNTRKRIRVRCHG